MHHKDSSQCLKSLTQITIKRRHCTVDQGFNAFLLKKINERTLKSFFAICSVFAKTNEGKMEEFLRQKNCPASKILKRYAYFSELKLTALLVQ